MKDLLNLSPRRESYDESVEDAKLDLSLSSHVPYRRVALTMITNKLATFRHGDEASGGRKTLSQEEEAIFHAKLDILKRDSDVFRQFQQCLVQANRRSNMGALSSLYEFLMDLKVPGICEESKEASDLQAPSQGEIQLPRSRESGLFASIASLKETSPSQRRWSGLPSRKSLSDSHGLPLLDHLSSDSEVCHTSQQSKSNQLELQSNNNPMTVYEMEFFCSQSDKNAHEPSLTETEDSDDSRDDGSVESGKSTSSGSTRISVSSSLSIDHARLPLVG